LGWFETFENLELFRQRLIFHQAPFVPIEMLPVIFQTFQPP